MSIIAGVDDLFFMAKILDAARRVGVTVEGIPAARIRERLVEASAAAVILDLNSASAVATIRELKSDPATRKVPVVGFVSHVATEVVSDAKNAGCDVVLARSAFSQKLPELLAELTRNGTGDIAEEESRSRL